MPVEMKLLVVERDEQPEDVMFQDSGTRYVYGKTIANFDLGPVKAMGGLKRWVESRREVPQGFEFYTYIEGSDERQFRDGYGDNLVALPMSDLIVVLSHDMTLDRRVREPALAMLRAFRDNSLAYAGNLFVLHYGH